MIMSQPITLKSKIIRNPELVENTIDGEVVMMSIESGEYFGLNEVGSSIWQLIENSTTVHDIIGKLLDEYDTTPQECIKDTIEFLEQLRGKNVIKVV
jgi:hypothetical protein